MTSDRDFQLAALAAIHFGIVSRRQLIALGFTARMIRTRVASGVLEQLAPNVFRIAGSPDTWQQRLWAAIAEAGDDAVASHRSAAALLGVPGFDPGPVEVTKRRGRHHEITLGTLHETFWLPPEHTRVIQGVRCTSLARTVVDMAATEHPLRVERMLENGLTRLGLTPGAVAEVLVVMGRSGRAGTTLIRQLLAERTDDYVPPESELESLFERTLRAHGVAVPRRQVALGDDSRFIGRVDYLFDEGVVVEVNGRPYHSALLDLEADAIRTSELAALGLSLVEVTWTQLVDDPAGVARRIKAARRERRHQIPPAEPGAPTPASAEQT